MRILCLHGFKQPSNSLKRQMNKSGFAESLGDVELVYIDAPNQNQWWSAEEAENEDGTISYRGYEDSIDFIETFAKKNAIDGLLGFSQGAALASILLGRQAQGLSKHEFKFGVLIGGFVPRDPAASAPLEGTSAILTPTLHVICGRDKIVPTEASEDLATRFHDPIVLRAEEARHGMPTPDTSMASALSTFFFPAAK